MFILVLINLKNETIFSLLDKSISRIRGWQTILLNIAERCTLIKAVLNSSPLYAMQSSVLPSSILNDLEKSSKKFLWNKVNHTYYYSRMALDVVCNPMGLGGLGFKHLQRWNICLWPNFVGI